MGAIQRELEENGPLQKQVDFFAKKLSQENFNFYCRYLFSGSTFC
jgi:hypothetical protein